MKTQLSYPLSAAARVAFAGMLAMLAPAPAVSADIIAAYRFETNNAAGFQASGFDADLLASAGPVTPHAGYSLFAAQNSGNEGGLSAYGANQPVLRLSRIGGSINLASAMTNNSYFSITLTPSSEVPFDSLTFNVSRGGSGGDRGYAVFSDLTGFNPGDALLHVPNINPANTRTFSHAESFVTIDLSNPPFANLEEPVTFRFYTFTNGDTASMEFDNIQFNAPQRSFTISPPISRPGQMLLLEWNFGEEITSAILNPGNINVTEDTNPETGEGAFYIESSPAEDTTYTLTYVTAQGYTRSIHGDFHIVQPGFSVSHDAAIAGRTPITFSWTLPEFTSASISHGGSETIDLTGLTDENGFGFTFDPVFLEPGTTEATLTYTTGEGTFQLSGPLTVTPAIFESATASGNGSPVAIDPEPMADGVLSYSDRVAHSWQAVPSFLIGAEFVKVGNNDKESPDFQITFKAAVDATFFLFIDNRVGDNIGGNNPVAGTNHPPTLGNGVMNWVLDSGFLDSGADLGIYETGSTQPINQSYSIYFRQVSAGEEFTFHAQNDGANRNMYGIAGVSPQIVPIAFVGNPTNIQEGQFSTLQWTVPPGSAVVIDQGVGDVTSLTDAITGVGSLQVSPPPGSISYMLAYDPPGAETPEVFLGPVTINVEALPPPPSDFRFTSIMVEGGSVNLEWPAPEGVTDPAALGDIIWRSIDLIGWDAIAAPVFVIDDGAVRFLDNSPPAGGKVFYRIQRN